MISHYRIIELVIECRVKPSGRQELIRWIKSNPRRNLNRVRKACWEHLSIFNTVALALDANHTRRHSRQELEQIEKLTEYFNTLSEMYPSAKWRGKYKRECTA